MTQRQLTGSRIRERRTMAGLRQAQLAEEVGISASYLNLIEHNRRRIGGKLLVRIASVLGLEPALLAEGAEAELIATLREAGASAPASGAEVDALEDFASRYPGWSSVLAQRHRRAQELERTVEALTDRLTHDPHLAASLHDMLSTVTAIRSTAAILADTKSLEPEWRDRFHRNINEDAARLARRSQALVTYLDDVGDMDAGMASPQDELEVFLVSHGFHFADLEEAARRGGDGQAEIEALVAEGGGLLMSATARGLALKWLAEYHEDACRLPLAQLYAGLAGQEADPAALARQFGVDFALVLRRMASVPPETGVFGLVSCDASGTMIHRKQIDGFALPRFGAGCPLLPLYRALSRPLVPLRTLVRQTGRGGGLFLTYAVAQPAGPVRFDEDPMFRAYMLIVPKSVDETDLPEHPIGVSCRICARKDCAARREPSILQGGL